MKTLSILMFAAITALVAFKTQQANQIISSNPVVEELNARGGKVDGFIKGLNDGLWGDRATAEVDFVKSLIENNQRSYPAYDLIQDSNVKHAIEAQRELDIKRLENLEALRIRFNQTSGTAVSQQED